MGSREILNLTGLSPVEAEKFVYSFAKNDQHHANSMATLLSCIFLADGMNKMESTRINAIFDLFDFSCEQKANLDELVLMLICVASTLSGILQYKEGVSEARIVEYVKGMFQSLDKSVYDEGESLTKEEFHTYAMSAWSALDDQTLENLFELWKADESPSQDEPEVEQAEVHSHKAHNYAHKNKESIKALNEAAKGYNHNVMVCMGTKAGYIRAKEMHENVGNRNTLIVRLVRFKELQEDAEKILEADKKYREELSKHSEAPEALTLALKGFHDQRTNDRLSIEQVIEDAKKDGVTLENFQILDSASEEDIQAAFDDDESGSVTTGDSAKLGELVPKYDTTHSLNADNRDAEAFLEEDVSEGKDVNSSVNESLRSEEETEL